VNITNCKLIDDHADLGGGILNSSTGTVNVTNCEVSDNRADFGGGILNNGTLNVRNSTIVNNKADDGGGIRNGFNNDLRATANITNSTINGNVAIGNGGGGGIANRFGTVNITGSTISNNRASNDFADGGGINNQFSVVNVVNVVNSIIRDNEAPFGGGISNSGTLNVRNSTINNNTAHGRETAAGHGGGIDNPNGIVDVSNSTISGNSSTSGGGISNFLDQCTVNVTNSTISGNSATFGGGIHNRRAGTVNVTNSTITGNSASANPAFGFAGGGVTNQDSGPFNVKSSIIALNTAAAGADLSGAFASHGFNLIGRTNGGTGFTAPTDLTGTDASLLNPQFDPNGPQDNGGPTQTIALQPDSPAIDKGTSAGLTGALTTDQRGTGFPRTFDDPAVAPATGGDNTDIGAFELQPLRITAGDSLLINESCPPANGAIDPGERVTVNLELINSGSTATSNLVATLQTSGGLLAPSNPQSYGAIPANGSAARDFSFTAEGSLISGQTITATLQLQDGATNLGTVSFNFTAGPTPCSFGRLVVTSSLSRANTSTVVGAITVQNIGSVIANDVTLTTAKLGTTNGTPLPQSLGNLAPGEFAVVTVNFNNSTPGSSSVLAAGGTYTGGTFSSSKRVTIP
jgi:hypothetical protein